MDCGGSWSGWEGGLRWQNVDILQVRSEKWEVRSETQIFISFYYRRLLFIEINRNLWCWIFQGYSFLMKDVSHFVICRVYFAKLLLKLVQHNIQHSKLKSKISATWPGPAGIWRDSWSLLMADTGYRLAASLRVVGTSLRGAAAEVNWEFCSDRNIIINIEVKVRDARFCNLLNSLLCGDQWEQSLAGHRSVSRYFWRNRGVRCSCRDSPGTLWSET